MAGSSAQDMQEQGKQAQQSSFAAQQPALHPMATGYTQPTPTLPISTTNMQGPMKSKYAVITMSRLSLLALTLSVMILGACTFLSGFLVGMWFAGPSTIAVSAYQAQMTPHYLPQQMAQMPTAPSQEGWVPPNFAQRIGPATGTMISQATIPNVPGFLSPLVSATQATAGEQVGYKVQQELSHQPVKTQPSQLQPSPPSQSAFQESAYRPQPSSPHLAGSHSLPISMPPPPPTKEANSSHSLNSHHPIHTQDEAYTVQIGVYASKDNARDLVNHLQALNYTSNVIEGKAPEGNSLYYVHSGTYHNYDAALEAASQFASQNIPGAIVVRETQDTKNAL